MEKIPSKPLLDCSLDELISETRKVDHPKHDAMINFLKEQFKLIVVLTKPTPEIEKYMKLQHDIIIGSLSKKIMTEPDDETSESADEDVCDDTKIIKRSPSQYQLFKRKLDKDLDNYRSGEMRSSSVSESDLDAS